ncbi:MAG TPA: SulP family inorganic anion transporter, partial [Trueperaceae bacterium]|nr:SulP family inorganic anion transporter [Trueperaceae bacterium]
MTRLRAFRPPFDDLVAGLTVALVLIPQSLAYATLAGLPPSAGLMAAIFPPLAAALFGSSPFLQTGPTALTSLLTLGVLAGSFVPGSPGYLDAAALLAVLVGVVRVILGLLRFGSVAYFMSLPVMRGFTGR